MNPSLMRIDHDGLEADPSGVPDAPLALIGLLLFVVVPVGLVWLALADAWDWVRRCR